MDPEDFLSGISGQSMDCPFFLPFWLSHPNRFINLFIPELNHDDLSKLLAAYSLHQPVL